MKVLLLTVFLSLLLSVLFLLFFVLQRKNKASKGAEQNALRPLENEKTEVASRK